MPGQLEAGERVLLIDPKERRYLLTLVAGATFHTHAGVLAHDDIIGAVEGCRVNGSTGRSFLVLRPTLSDIVLKMPRGAQVIYPKDLGAILIAADIGPGQRVLEAGVGSGALTCSLLRAVGDGGRVYSYERREDFAEIAARNVRNFFGGEHPAWTLTVGDLVASLRPDEVDRVVLDMLAPWECVDAVAKVLAPGGVLICYVATTTQLSRTVEALREHGRYAEPAPFETMVRTWHVEGLAVRPDHRMVGHTGFLVTARRIADGVDLPPRRRRPAKGAAELGEVWDGGATPDEPLDESEARQARIARRGELP